MKAMWFEDWPWDSVVTINPTLCQEKGALHQMTSTGGEKAKKLWDSVQTRELALREAIEILRVCHHLAPFCFYNGNTFVAIGRIMIHQVMSTLPPDKAFGFRSIVGHYIAGTTGADELEQVLRHF